MRADQTPVCKTLLGCKTFATVAHTLHHLCAITSLCSTSIASGKKIKLLPHEPLHVPGFGRPLEAPIEEDVARDGVDRQEPGRLEPEAVVVSVPQHTLDPDRERFSCSARLVI